MKVIYVKKELYNKFRLDRFPSAGPKANITGMRKHYWGYDGYIVQCGSYLYNIDFLTYDEILRFGGKQN